MATVKEKIETGGDVIDASNHQLHKAGDLKELMIAAGLDKHAQVDGGSGKWDWKRFGVLILIIMCIGLTLASFFAYIQMLNVQGRVGLLSADLPYDELVATQWEIGRASAIWFYFSMASMVCGAAFLGSALVLVFLHHK